MRCWCSCLCTACQHHLSYLTRKNNNNGVSPPAPGFRAPQLLDVRSHVRPHTHTQHHTIWSRAYHAYLAACVHAVEHRVGTGVPEAYATVRCAATAGQQAVLVGRPGDRLDCCCVLGEARKWLAVAGLQGKRATNQPINQMLRNAHIQTYISSQRSWHSYIAHSCCHLLLDTASAAVAAARVIGVPSTIQNPHLPEYERVVVATRRQHAVIRRPLHTINTSEK